MNPFSMNDIPYPSDKVIGTKEILSTLPNCQVCGNSIKTHGYQYTAKIKDAALSGDAILCYDCHHKFAKNNFISNSFKEFQIILIILLIILPWIIAIFNFKIFIIIFAICLCLFIINRYLYSMKRNIADDNFKKIISIISKKGIEKITVEDLNNVEPFGLPFYTSAREQVVPIPLSIIVNINCPISEISQEKLIKIFSGELKSWSEIGGSDYLINCYIPEKTNRDVKWFIKNVLNGKELNNNAREIKRGLISLEISKDDNGIGFEIFSFYDGKIFPGGGSLFSDKTKILKINGQTCSCENGNYPLWVVPC